MTTQLNQTQRKMLWTERFRNALVGPVPQAAGGNGILFLVAISYFNFSPDIKGVLAGATYYGLISSLFVLPVLARLGWSINRIMPGLMLISGAALLTAASTEIGVLYVVSVMLSVCCLMLAGPMMTSLWRQQIPDSALGRLFSQISVIVMIANLVFAYTAAWYVGDDISRFRPVVTYLGIALLFGAVFAWQLPHQTLSANRQNPFNLLALLWKDKLFGYISFTWMILGFGNLATIPMRTEHLIGLEYDPDWILIIVAVIPAVGSIFSTMIWGRLFDRMNFILLRICINIFFALSIFLFFSDALWMQCLGSICFGCGVGGGNVAWNLWVTKFSTPERTTDYQTVHGFLTGMRGVTGPIVAYALWINFNMDTVVWMCGAMVVGSCFLLIPVIKHGNR